MKVSDLRIQNFKSFDDSGIIDFSNSINILLGANNAGKSTILKTLHFLQKNTYTIDDDIRIGQQRSYIDITLDEVDLPPFEGHSQSKLRVQIAILFSNKPGQGVAPTIKAINNTTNIGQASADEPYNFIYPYFSKRKVQGYHQNINIGEERAVKETLQNLVAKIARLANDQHPEHEEYERACRDILGFPIRTFASSGGMQAGIIVDSYHNIPLEAMGEGVPNLLGLIVNLCMAENKLFLIEELENDIHPQALKKLLQLIHEKSSKNQFLISTHSNIVTSYLGSFSNSKIHQITIAPYSNSNRIPTSTYKAVGNTPEERLAILEDLGYDLADSDIWTGWLFLEESSAEQIIREFLIPEFTPKISQKVKTVSTNGTGRVKARFEALNNLFLFTHLTPVYINRAWIMLDGDEAGREAINLIKEKYINAGSVWKEENFINLKEDDFERYYPKRFSAEVDEVLCLPPNSQREAKKNILHKVIDFIEKEKEAAREEFKTSANEVIENLKKIEAALFPAPN